MTDTFENFIKRCQRVSDILIKHRQQNGGSWSYHESINRIYEEVAELSRVKRKDEGMQRELEEASDIILATIAHLNLEGFSTFAIQGALGQTLQKIELRADALQKTSTQKGISDE